MIEVKGNLPTDYELALIVESWGEYLLKGENSGNNVARKIAKTLPSPMLSKSSVTLYRTGLKQFLLASESIRSKMLQMQSAGLLDSDTFISERKLFPKLGNKRELSVFERKAMIQNDLLASVIKGGAKYTSVRFFPPLKDGKREKYDEDKAFPFDRIVDFLNAILSPRDKCIFALLAASGGRISEILQTTRRDIDFENNLVFLTDHSESGVDEFEIDLSIEDAYKIGYKSRETRETFLLYPYSELFFQYLHDYWDDIPTTEENDFLFCSHRPNEWGKPLILCNYSTIYKAFVRAANKLFGEGHGYGPHSLRHSYGFYLVNYCPNHATGGWGLSTDTVKEFMAHAEIASTECYAIRDRKLSRIEMEVANRVIFEMGGNL